MGTKAATFLKTRGTDIVDGDGNVVLLKGTNLGGWLLQEEWMCPVVGNSNLNGALTQMETLDALSDRFGFDKSRELIRLYQYNWITEDDFKRMADLGMNAIRVPFGYWNFMKDGKGEWLTADLDKNPGFQTLDWVIAMGEKYGLYIILDMHGCPGGQTGDHTAGSYRKCLLYDDPTYQDVMEKLWVTIAKRYCNNTTVVAYDIMNEPKEFDVATPDDDPRNKLYDRMIEAIREVDPNHMAIVEAIWQMRRLPTNPQARGWANVLYSPHVYRQDAAVYERNLTRYLKNNPTLNVPIYIGEFFNTDMMQICVDNGWSFTSWCYKAMTPSENAKEPYGLYCNDTQKFFAEYAAAGLSADALTDAQKFLVEHPDADPRVNVLNDSAETIAKKWGAILKTDSGYYMETPAVAAWKALKL